MLNENQNSQGWKNKLEDTAGLGEATCRDKNALWQQLDKRLNEKPRRKKMVWYWAAAACLLLAIVLPFIKHTTTTNTSRNNSVVIKQPVAPGPLEIVTEPLSTPVENKNLAEKRQFIKVVTKSIPIQDLPGKDLPATIIATINPPAQIVNQPEQIITPQNIATPVVTAAAGPVLRQKLKVVHINELGYPEETPRREDHIADYRSIRFNPVSPETYTSASSAPAGNDLNIFKTKTSPSN